MNCAASCHRLTSFPCLQDAAQKKERLTTSDEQRERNLIAEQIERAKAEAKTSSSSGSEEEKEKLNVEGKVKNAERVDVAV